MTALLPIIIAQTTQPAEPLPGWAAAIVGFIGALTIVMLAVLAFWARFKVPVLDAIGEVKERLARVETKADEAKDATVRNFDRELETRAIASQALGEAKSANVTATAAAIAVKTEDPLKVQT